MLLLQDILLTLIQGLIFVIYVTFLLIYFKGPLESISDSWYKLPFPLKYLFTLFTSSLGVLMFYQGVGDIWFVISGAGLCFVGFSTAFKDYETITPIVHTLGAAVGIVFALLGIGFQSTWVPLIVFSIGAVLLVLASLIFKMKNRTWWIEILAFLCVIVGLLF